MLACRSVKQQAPLFVKKCEFQFFAKNNSKSAINFQHLNAPIGSWVSLCLIQINGNNLSIPIAKYSIDFLNARKNGQNF